MPLPIWPAPTTPSVRISMAGLYCARADESNRALVSREPRAAAPLPSGLGLRLTANGSRGDRDAVAGNPKSGQEGDADGDHGGRAPHHGPDEGKKGDCPEQRESRRQGRRPLRGRDAPDELLSEQQKER